MAPSGRLARQCTTHLHPRNAVAEFPRQGHTAAGVVEQHGDVQGDGRCGGVDGVLVVDCALQLAQCLDSRPPPAGAGGPRGWRPGRRRRARRRARIRAIVCARAGARPAGAGSFYPVRVLYRCPACCPGYGRRRVPVCGAVSSGSATVGHVGLVPPACRSPEGYGVLSVTCPSAASSTRTSMCALSGPGRTSST